MARVSKDHIDKFFDYGVDLDSRTIYLGSVERLGEDDDEDGSGTDFMMAERAIKALHLLEYAAPDGSKPIVIIMNNAGGSEYHGMAVYDAIRSCKNQVIAKVYGHAASMGSLILQACDKRCLAPNSRFMIHYGTWGVYDHPKISYKDGEQGKLWDVVFEDIYLNRMMQKDEQMRAAGEERYLETLLTNWVNRHNETVSLRPSKPVKYKFSLVPEKRREDVLQVLRILLDFDTTMTPEETVAFGFADEVLETFN